MLKTFLLLTIVWNPEKQGHDVYVMDTGLSAADCIHAAEEQLPTADAMGWTVACEIER